MVLRKLGHEAMAFVLVVAGSGGFASVSSSYKSISI